MRFVRALWRQDKSVAFGIVLGLILSALLIIFALGSITGQLRAKPPYTLTKDGVHFENQALCPGDDIAFSIEFRINRAPIILMRVRTIWSIGENATKIWDESPEYGIWTEPILVRAIVKVPVPTGLTPGDYELRSGTQENNSEPSVLTVPFSVKEGCTP